MQGLRELMAVAWDPLLVVDCASRRIVDANPAAGRLYGLRADALIGRDLGDFFSESQYIDDIFDQHRDYVPLRFQRGQLRKHFPVEIAIRYFATEVGEHAALAIRDISDRLERERQDSESERKYKNLFNASPYPILILNSHGMIVDANSCAQLYYGYEFEELTKLDWHELDSIGAPLRFSARPTLIPAREHRRRDGTTFMAEVMLSYFRVRTQGLILALVRDVTEHWQTFRQLQESEARWRFAIEGSGDAIVEIPLVAGDTFYVSPVLSEMLGYDPQADAALSLQEWLDRVHPDDFDRLEAAIRSHVEGGAPMIRDEHRLHQRQGGYRWVSFRAKQIEVARQRTRLIGAVRDIHETRMRLLQENAARSKLFRLERMATAGEMLSALAHEVNQPLTAISNYSALAIRQFAQPANAEKVNRSLSVISEQALRAGEIVRRIREFVRRGEPNVALANINTLITRVAGWCENDAGTANVELHLELAPQLPDIRIDILQIEQVLFNLIRNGIEAMMPARSDARPLVVGSRRSDDGITVFVRDLGCGLEESLIADMFEPFVSSKAEGMGMGLAISRTIIEAHGGYIRAESNLNEPGALFLFALPLTSAGTP